VSGTSFLTRLIEEAQVIVTNKPLLTLTSADLMSQAVIVVPQAMSLRAAAHLLSENQISGAPVVDEIGACVGVLSATDFMHWVGYGERAAARPTHANPGCFHSAWQIGNVDALPTDAVVNYMTADPVTVFASTSIAELAREMTDAHIHRVIVVDAKYRPIGVVSSIDILAAVAYADRHQSAGLLLPDREASPGGQKTSRPPGM
jgi:CBS-domain-containing membrane protein